jgi:Transposase and inactivated derivatives
MIKVKTILRMEYQEYGVRTIASCCGHSKNTVKKVIRKAKELEYDYLEHQAKSNEEMYYELFPKAELIQTKKGAIDVEYIHNELKKSGVNIQLLWQEYVDTCKQSNQEYMSYSRYCTHYRAYKARNMATMHLNREPGECIEVDWAGTTLHIKDAITGEMITTYLFVSCFPYSRYGYAQATYTQNLEDWIDTHVKMFSYFGRVPKMIVPDNLKTGVTSHTKHQVVIQKQYQELAEHYNVAIYPARVRKPKDKASVESTVNHLTTWIIAALRHETFFTLQELNERVLEKLTEYNQKPFQKRVGSRESIFYEEEFDTLYPLPTQGYELAFWKKAKVQYNYHISVEKMHYSIPYEYIKHEVDVRITKRMIEVFYKNNRICAHKRLYGEKTTYSTITEHMPPKHQEYGQWNKERFIAWSKVIGKATHQVIVTIFEYAAIEQRAYKTCMAILNLESKFSQVLLETACTQALTYTSRPSYNHIASIIKQLVPAEPVNATQYGYLRGASYYDNKGNEDK